MTAPEFFNQIYKWARLERDADDGRLFDDEANDIIKLVAIARNLWDAQEESENFIKQVKLECEEIVKEKVA